MTLNVNQHFVDRSMERARFANMLSSESDERVLRVLVPPGHGKSWFLTRLFFDCEDRGMPVVTLDFDARRSNRPVDVRYVVERFLELLGEQRLPETAARAAEWRRSTPAPETNAQHRAALGRSLRHDLSHWIEPLKNGIVDEFSHYETGIATLLTRLGKAHPRYLEAVNYQTRLIHENIAVVRLHGDTYDLKAERSQILAQINRLTLDVWDALFSTLCILSEAETTSPPIVILLDTFEQIRDTIRDWLSGWLFDGLRRDLKHVRVVVAGRPTSLCHTFFDQADSWGHLVASIDQFTPMPDDDILEYYQRRECSFDNLDPNTICHLARTSAGMMAQVGDNLPQANNG